MIVYHLYIVNIVFDFGKFFYLKGFWVKGFLG